MGSSWETWNSHDGGMYGRGLTGNRRRSISSSQAMVAAFPPSYYCRTSRLLLVHEDVAMCRMPRTAQQYPADDFG